MTPSNLPSNSPTFGSVISELQTIISVSYISAVGIGMLFNFKKYDQFGINIFDYADVFDFLIAPFADGIIILFTIASVLMAYLLFRLDVFWERRFPTSYARMSFGLHNKPWYSFYRYITTIFLGITYLYLSASVYGRMKTRSIKQQQEVSVVLTDNEVQKGIMIGKTRDIVFLLTKEKVKAIPISSSVKEFEIR
jgi:hypothetical protein